MKNRSITILVTVISVLLYFLVFYSIERHDSIPLVSIYLLLFAGYLYYAFSSSRISIRYVIGLAMLFRLIPLFAIPSLSDDFYRFIWDGVLWSNGINPFAYTPIQIIDHNIITISGFTDQIFNNLNSQVTYTVYPTIPQIINLVAFYIGGENLLANIIIQRIFIISADLLGIYYLIKILEQRKLGKAHVVLYALNPLVIMELSGNLHHEALMIAFFLGFLYYAMRHKVVISGALLALSIGSKLLPLMFVPLILLNSKSRARLFLSMSLALIILLLPIVDSSFIKGMASSLSLYYQKFEFNAGLYYLAREVGYWYYGYNAIALIGKTFLVLSFILIIGISFFGYKKKVDQLILYNIIYLVFALLSLILHPWYILILIAMAPLTRLRYSIVWSLLIFLTYLGYGTTGFSENYWVVTLEYFGLVIALFFDWKNQAFESDTLKEAP